MHVTHYRIWKINLPVTAGLFLLLVGNTFAQSELTGRIVDNKNEALVGVPVILTAQSDTTQKKYALTDTAGVFRITDLSPQIYQLRATYLGYKDFTRQVVISQPEIYVRP